MESQLFIDKILMSLGRKNIWALSVHDGIYVQKQRQKEVEKLVLEMLGDGIAEIFGAKDKPHMEWEETQPKWLVEKWGIPNDILP